jgi:hypothetical protein
VKAALDNATLWWDSLGNDTPVRQVVETLAGALQRAEQLPEIAPADLLGPEDVPENIRAVSAWLMQKKFPRLADHTPAIRAYMVQRCLESALCTGWDGARETLHLQIQTWYEAHDTLTRAEVWSGHWETDGRLVLTSPLYRDLEPFQANKPYMVVVAPWWPEQRPDELHNAVERARVAAWQLDGGREPPPLVGQPRGPSERYDRMVEAYHAWVKAGSPGTPDKPGTIPGFTKTADRALLRRAILWLHPEDSEDFDLEH